MKKLIAGLGILALVASSMLPAFASTTSGKPQVLVAVTNSQSMDGDLTGAIFTGSGTVAGLQNSASPVNYPVPTGFTPPLQAASAGQAPYTVVRGSSVLDNSYSRLNVAKAAIQSTLQTYLSSFDFGLETYSTASTVANSTWVYYLSGPQGFTFSSSPVAGVLNLPNPCYRYTTNSSSAVSSACSKLASKLYGSTLQTSAYMQAAKTSDAQDVNDVLYAPNGSLAPVFVAHGGTSPATPYPPNYSATDYERGRVAVGYDTTTPGGFSLTFTPTNAGYTPYAPQVMFVQRGFGFGTQQPSDLSATSGAVVVPLQTTGPSSGAAAQVPSVMQAFLPYLAPEQASAGTPEIKAVAGQSPIAGILATAKSYLASAQNSACAGQYVILVTDGLPTLDKQGRMYPPLGSFSAQQYGFTATFNPDGSLASTNDQAVADAVSAVQALHQAGVKTYVVGLGAGVDPSVNPAAAQTLQALAVAGGTQQAYSANSQASLNNALNTIATAIEASSAISAPVAPLSVQTGSLVFQLTSDQSPLASHVKAYAVNPDGSMGQTALWDASSQMTASQRSSAMLSTSSSGAIVPFANLDSGAFAVSATPCVPDAATVIRFTEDPTYAMTSSSGSTCSYLAGRTAASLPGPLDGGNTAQYMGAPANALLLSDPTYLTFARAQASRPRQLLYTDADGWMYSVSATGSGGGQLLWAWTPRPFAAQLQNVNNGLFHEGLFDGGFSIVDAKDSTGAWASYVVGTAQGGAYHYALRLDSTGKPTALAWDDLQTGSTSAQAQAPVIARIGGVAYAVYVTTSGSTSTLVEQPLTGGASSTYKLPFTVTSSLSYDVQAGALYVGDASGKAWEVQVSGDAKSDAGSAVALGSSVDGAAVLYVGTGQVHGTSVAWLASKSSLTLYTFGGTGWQRTWSSTTSTATYYGGTTSSQPPQQLPSNATISAAPVLGGNVLAVPLSVAPASSVTCGQPVAELMFFNPLNGSFPTGQVAYRTNGAAVTGTLALGTGQAFSPGVAVGSQGTVLFPGGSSQLVPPTSLNVGATPVDAIVQWEPF